jgi:hypothetical protein
MSEARTRAHDKAQCATCQHVGCAKAAKTSRVVVSWCSKYKRSKQVERAVQ